MFLISYDISSDRLRNKVAKLLEGYGRRVQYSVFECTISEKRFNELRSKLTKLMTDSEDAGIRIYRICANCEKQIYVIGVTEKEPKPPDDDVFVI